MISQKVSIIILQYNNSSNTMVCLNSVKNLAYENFEIIVIDNASEDKEIDSIEKYLENKSNITLIKNNMNLGYPGGNNIGIKQAIRNKADYILLLNNDTTVEKNLLLKLIAAGETNRRIGLLGPLISEDNQIIYGGKISWLKPELEHNKKYLTHNTNFFISGAALLIKREVVEKIGLLDERYFLYFEDADYCLRAEKVDFELKIVPEAIIYHQVSSSTKKLGPPLLLRYHYRNAHLFNIRHAPIFTKILLPFWSIWVIIKQLLKMAFLPSRRHVSKQILLGVSDFYLGKFGKL